MEDIICPQCGRPNLIEAKKCWYCQTCLQDIKNNKMDSHPPESPAENVNKENKETSLPIEDIEQEIPAWLKRIRDLKEADQPPEEDDPDWQQQDLFIIKNDNQQRKKPKKKKSPPKKKIAQKKINTEKKNDNPVDLTQEKPFIFQRGKKADMQEKPEPGSAIQEDDALSHDLPEGFTKL